MFFQTDIHLEVSPAHSAVIQRSGDVQLLMVIEHVFRLERLSAFLAFVPVLAVRF